MRIETKEGAARYGRSIGWHVAMAPVLLAMMLWLIRLQSRSDEYQQRLTAAEQGAVGRRQIDVGVPAAYQALAARMAYIEEDLASCHGRWGATYSQLEDFIGGNPGKRHSLPNRPPPAPRLPADFCGVLATVAAAQGLGPCTPLREPPTVPLLPDQQTRAPARGGGAR